ncbi:MAG: glycosyltransferase family 61 protein [Clostridia bacterium]|nr:glycosyltransferase family 61 protein [Clostridia bacterium]
MNLDYSLLYNPAYFEKRFQQRYYIRKALGLQKYANATILPWKLINHQYGGGIVTAQGEYLSNTGLHYGNGVAYAPDKVNESQDKVIYIGMFAGIWGHCLTDNIRRLWFLSSKAYLEDYKDYKVVYTPFSSFYFYDSFKQLLSVWGVDPDHFIAVTEPTRYREIIIPDESFYTNEEGFINYTDEYRDMIDQVRAYGTAHRTDLKQTKYYFSYSKLPRSAGRVRLERFFSEHGYDIVYPEKLTFFEQLNILINATDFASTVGSCSHNALFLRDETNVLLIPRGNYLTGYQEAIDEIHPLNIRYVDSSMSVYLDDATPWSGPFYFYISDNLCKAFDLDHEKAAAYTDLSGFWEYKQKSLIMRSINACKKAHRYYSDEYLDFIARKHQKSVVWKMKHMLFEMAKRCYHFIHHS